MPTESDLAPTTHTHKYTLNRSLTHSLYQTIIHQQKQNYKSFTNKLMEPKNYMGKKKEPIYKGAK